MRAALWLVAFALTAMHPAYAADTTFVGPACKGEPAKSASTWKDYSEIRLFDERSAAFKYARSRWGAPHSCAWRSSNDTKLRLLAYDFPGGFRLIESDSADMIDSRLIRLDVDGLSEEEALRVLKEIVKDETALDDTNPGEIVWSHPVRGKGAHVPDIDVLRFDADKGDESAMLLIENGKVTQIVFRTIEYLYD